MMLDLDWIRRELLLAIGLVACGPDGGVDDPGDGSGDGSSADEGTTQASGPSSTTAPPSWPDPPWCGLASPPDARPPRACDDPLPLMQNGTEVESGWVNCTSGLHRVAAVECIIPEGSVGTCNPETADAPECMTDADCDAAPNGYCQSMIDGMFGPETCGCAYACTSDADCGEDELCYCAGAGSYCVTAYCKTDADCDEGYHCWMSGNVVACDTPFDTCGSGQDCLSDECPSCEYQPDLCASECVPDLQCTAGRPFLVRGEARRASLRGVVRDELARYWAACGLAEHASVAAFARFALQLMSLGAPAELLADTARAMSDEVEHARLCFALATRYAGTTIEAGPIATDDALVGVLDLVTIAELVAKEACMGETLAAIEAAEQLACARDPEVRSALERIAADELRHAALGWRFLAWALTRTDADGRTRIHAALAHAIAEPRTGATSRPNLAAHGVLPDHVRHEVARRGLAEVVQPLARSLGS